MTVSSISLATLDPNLLARWAGSVAFALAAGSCLMAWHATTRTSTSRDGRLWLGLALGYLVLLVDLQLDLRFALGRWLESLAGSEGVYATRRPWQFAALGVLAGAEVFFLAWPVRHLVRSHRTLLAVALAGASFNGLLWFAEIVSWHALDALLYMRLGPVMLIVPAWLCGAAVVSIAALSAARSAAAARQVP